MRSLASALNILVSHLLGDAISPTIQGKVRADFTKLHINMTIVAVKIAAVRYSRRTL